MKGTGATWGHWCGLDENRWPKTTTVLEPLIVEKHPYSIMYIVRIMQSIQWLQVFEKKTMLADVHAYIPRSKSEK